MANMKLVLPGSVNCQILPGSESRQAAIRLEAAFVTPFNRVATPSAHHWTSEFNPGSRVDTRTLLEHWRQHRTSLEGLGPH